MPYKISSKFQCSTSLQSFPTADNGCIVTYSSNITFSNSCCDDIVFEKLKKISSLHLELTIFSDINSYGNNDYLVKRL